MNGDKIFMWTIHIIAAILMIIVCCTIDHWGIGVDEISVPNKFFCVIAIVLLTWGHYKLQQYEP